MLMLIFLWTEFWESWVFVINKIETLEYNWNYSVFSNRALIKNFYLLCTTFSSMTLSRLTHFLAYVTAGKKRKRESLGRRSRCRSSRSLCPQMYQRRNPADSHVSQRKQSIHSTTAAGWLCNTIRNPLFLKGFKHSETDWRDTLNQLSSLEWDQHAYESFSHDTEACSDSTTTQLRAHSCSWMDANGLKKKSTWASLKAIQAQVWGGGMR